jgi:hypothetical protein
MARVWLDDRLCERGDLPDVCMQCGNHTTNRMRKTFHWTPPWVLVTILAGLPIYVILAIVLRKTVRAEVPLCDAHKRHWLYRTLVILLGLLAAIVLTIVIAVIVGNLPPGNSVRDVLPFSIFLVWIVWLVGAVVATRNAIRPLEIQDNRGIQLGGVCREFADAYREHEDEVFEASRRRRADRAALEHWNEREPRRPSGRGDRVRREDEEDDRRRTSRDRDREDEY